MASIEAGALLVRQEEEDEEVVVGSGVHMREPRQVAHVGQLRLARGESLALTLGLIQRFREGRGGHCRSSPTTPNYCDGRASTESMSGVGARCQQPPRTGPLYERTTSDFDPRTVATRAVQSRPFRAYLRVPLAYLGVCCALRGHCMLPQVRGSGP